MKLLFMTVCACVFFNGMISATEETRREYLELIKAHPQLVSKPGDYTKGEIEIILDPTRMAAIEQKMARDVGVVYRDRYLMLVNDACQFPNGKEGVYVRVLWVNGLDASPGVAVMPILPDGRIVLNCNYRHATRSWEIELPRGNIAKGESPEDAARRESLEETGMIISSLKKLGDMPPDSGLTGSIIPIYAARVVDHQDAMQDDYEAIEEVFALSVNDIKQGFQKGYIDYKIRGEMQRVMFRDPFLAFALMLMAN